MFKKTIGPFVIAALFVASQAIAGQVLLPVFAHALPGASGNLWYTEVSLINPTQQTITVDPPVFLPGTMQITHPCLPPARQVEVPAESTVIWKPWDIAMELGCPDSAVGALLISADGPLVVTGRMTNVRDEAATETGPLEGFGQTIDGIDVSSLPAGQETVMLPGMIWHPNACGPRQFDAYVGFANPGDEPLDAIIDLGPQAGDSAVYIDHKLMDLPAKVTVPAKSWIQVQLLPVNSVMAVCLEPQRFDLLVTLKGPMAVYGSVVDRSTQDPRTILPVPVETETNGE